MLRKFIQLAFDFGVGGKRKGIRNFGISLVTRKGQKENGSKVLAITVNKPISFCPLNLSAHEERFGRPTQIRQNSHVGFSGVITVNQSAPTRTGTVDLTATCV